MCCFNFDKPLRNLQAKLPCIQSRPFKIQILQWVHVSPKAAVADSYPIQLLQFKQWFMMHYKNCHVSSWDPIHQTPAPHCFVGHPHRSWQEIPSWENSVTMQTTMATTSVQLPHQQNSKTPGCTVFRKKKRGPKKYRIQRETDSITKKKIRNKGTKKKHCFHATVS